MGTILDIILCVIAVCFIISGFMIGFVRSLVELIGYIIAIVAAFMLSDSLATVAGKYLLRSNPTGLSHIVVKVICMVVIFVILQLVTRLIARALDTVFKLPVLHQVNSLLGGVFGLVKGVLAVFFICAILQLMLPIVSAALPNIKANELSKSSIYAYLYVNNPIYLLYQAEI